VIYLILLLVIGIIAWIVALVREALESSLKIFKLENRISKLEGIIKRNNLW